MQSPLSREDRRRWKRQIVERPCLIRSASGQRITARTVDLSPGGVLIELPSMEFDVNLFRVGQRIDVEVPLLKGRSRATMIAYSVRVARVENRLTAVRIACRSVRVRLQRSRSLEMPAVESTAYAM